MIHRIASMIFNRRITTYLWHCGLALMLWFTGHAGVVPLGCQAQDPQPPRSTEATANEEVRMKLKEQLTVDITPPAGTGADGKPYPLPADFASKSFALPMRPEFRDFAPIEKRPLGDWNFARQPLLFEEVNAERYGEGCTGLQPAVSVAKFYARTLMLPYSTIRTSARQPRYFPHVDRPGYSGVRETKH